MEMHRVHYAAVSVRILDADLTVCGPPKLHHEAP